MPTTIHITRWPLIIVLVGVMTMSSCSNEDFTALSPDATLVAFGDSLTYGVGTDKAHSYPSLLAAMTGLRVINAGISGETTSQGLKRFQSVLDTHSPELVVLLEGGNDILRGHDYTSVKRNLASMIAMAQAEGVQVLLIGVPEKKLFSDSAPWYAELAREYQLVFDGEILSSLLRTPKFKSDPIHLNADGYRKLAERVNEILSEQGALPDE